jgi:Tfp pilus assembly protein PilV
MTEAIPRSSRFKIPHLVIVKAPGLLPMQYTAQELAEELSISESTLRDWLYAARRIPGMPAIISGSTVSISKPGWKSSATPNGVHRASSKKAKATACAATRSLRCSIQR